MSLVDVDESVLAQLVEAATSDASAGEVTPPLTAGHAWTPQRMTWLYAFHRDRRDSIDGPCREATWAVVEDGRVVGSVRLRRTDTPGVLEAGIWLTRSARGRGVGTAALVSVLDHARSASADAVRADTTVANVSAQGALRALGFELEPGHDAGTITAVRALGPGAS